MAWHVKYRIEGFHEEYSSPPYETEALANDHRDDIGGYEGVTYAIVVYEESAINPC